MKKFILPVLLLFSVIGNAQNSTFTKVFNNDSSDNAHAMFQTTNGDYYLLASTNSFGAGGVDIQVTRTNGLGEVIWSYAYGTSGNDVGYEIKPTSDGGAVIAGYSDGISSFDNGLIFKINNTGTTQWARIIQFDSNIRCKDIIQARSGSYYATGYIELDSLEKNIMVVLLNSAGTVSWIKSYGGVGDDYGNALVEDSKQKIVIVGSTTNDSVTIGGNGDKDIQLLTINAGGTIIRSRNLGTSSDEEATSILAPSANKFIIGGNTFGGSGTGQDVFITELDTNFSVGNSNWYGTLGDDKAFNIAHILNGETTMAVSTNVGPSASDIIVFQTNSSGAVTNQNTIGGMEADANAYIDVARSSALGYTFFASGVSLGNTNSEDLYLMNVTSSLSTVCSDQGGGLQIQGAYSLSSNGHNNLYNVGQSGSASLTRTTITNNDSTLCCKLEAQTAGDSFTICTNDQLNIGRSSRSGITYSWTALGSSWTSASSNPSVSPASNTLYKLVVSSTDSVCLSDSSLVYVKVNTRQTIPAIADTFVCVNDSVVLSAASNMINYSWTTNTGFFNTQSIEFKNSDTAYLSMIDQNSCIYRDTVKIDLIQLPTFSLGNDTTICENLSITLAGPTGMANYKWNGTNSASNTYVTNSSQVHTLEVTSSYGCKASDQIQILTNPSSPFSLGADTTFCEGETFTIVGPTVLNDYIWNDTASNNYSIDVLTGGTYWLEAYNSFDCPSYDTIVLTMLSAPTFSLGNDTGFCDGGNIVLQGPNGTLDYLWFNGSDQQFFTATGTGKYYLKVTDGNDCSYTDTIDIEEYDLPTFSLGNDTTFKEGNSLNLTPGSGYVSYDWSTNETTETITVDKSGTYSVEVVDANGCKGSDTIVVTVTASIQYLNGRKIEMYPNPASAELNLVTDGNMIGSRIEIVDMQGKVVYSKVASSNALNIKINEFESGLYYLILNKDNTNLTFKVMIDHQ